jgi:hypothetical protein
MQASDQNAYSDELLTRYLLGDLPADQAEKLDELSVADDELAWRLSGVEYDLVDDFVRGELRGDNLNRFRSFYLSSARRRQKVEFAAGLLELRNRAALVADRSKPALAHRGWWHGPALFRQWSLAAAALALLLVAAYLFTDDLRLRRQMNEAAADHTSMEQELARQRAANARVQGELEHARGTTAIAAQLNTVALLLAPPSRGAAGVEKVSIQPATDLVVLLLALEADEFPRYRVTLKDVATQQEVWHSTDLGSSSSAGRKTVTVGVPANLLRQQRYLAELAGVQRNGSAVPMGDYPFDVVSR